MRCARHKQFSFLFVYFPFGTYKYCSLGSWIPAKIVFRFRSPIVVAFVYSRIRYFYSYCFLAGFIAVCFSFLLFKSYCMRLHRSHSLIKMSWHPKHHSFDVISWEIPIIICVCVFECFSHISEIRKRKRERENRNTENDESWAEAMN